MKRIKKTLALLLASILIAAAIPMVISAEGLADHLIVHYDFEEGNGGVLADKATAGNSEALVQTGSGVEIRDGKAYIPATANSHLTLDKSADIAMRQSSLTVFVRFSANLVNTSGQENVAFWVRNIGNITMDDVTDSTNSLNMRYQYNGTSSNFRHFAGADNLMYHGADVINVAFTISYVGDQLTLKSYFMFDGDIENAVVASKVLTDATYTSTNSRMITVGNDNSTTKTNKFDYIFDDVRVYNTVLSETQIKGIATELYEADSSAGNTKFAGWQTTDFDGGYCDLRAIGVLKDVDKDGDINDEYQAVGFEITMMSPTKSDGTKWTNIDATTGNAPQIKQVYTSVLGKDNESKTVSYSASQLGGDFIFVASVEGIKQNVGRVIFKITTFHDDLEGNRVNDDSFVVRYNTVTAEEA